MDEVRNSAKKNTGQARADPEFLSGGGAPLRNDVTIQDFSQEGVHF